MEVGVKWFFPSELTHLGCLLSRPLISFLNRWRVPWFFNVFGGFWSSSMGSMVAAFRATDSSVDAEANAE